MGGQLDSGGGVGPELTRRMMAAVDRAVEALGEPLTPDEQAAGWTEDMLQWARDLAGHWKRTLRTAPASTLGSTNLAHAFDGAPGTLGDPRRQDDRKTALLHAGLTISNVQEMDRLRANVLELCDDLTDPSSPLTADVAPEGAAGVAHGLRDLLTTIDNTGATQEAWDRWRDDLTAFGAKWRVRTDMPLFPGMPALPGMDQPQRFWENQPGALWQRLRSIDGELERLVMFRSFMAGEPP